MFLIISAIIILSIYTEIFEKRGYIRHLPAINAISEAIGRAVECGKPVLYLTGLYDMNAIATIASINILAHVSKTAAIYEAEIKVPCCRSFVLSAARETVRESFLRSGKIDRYRPEDIMYLTDEQWGFAAGVSGIMTRERPAAAFYFGQFVSESLIYAETGHAIGAVQIAGTNEFSQIPFLVVTCDYCLMGEELFAAAAYLSNESRDIGTIYGQDRCKLLMITVIVIGVVFETLAKVWPQYMSGLSKFKMLFVSE
jgi:hypothetical protein